MDPGDGLTMKLPERAKSMIREVAKRMGNPEFEEFVKERMGKETEEE